MRSSESQNSFSNDNEVLCFFKVIDHFNENKQVDVSRSMLKIWATELLKIDVNQEINGQKMIAHMLKYRLSLKKK